MKTKKILTLVTCIVVLFSVSVPSASAVTWGDDVSEGEWFQYDISISLSLSLSDYPFLKFVSLSYSARCIVTVDNITSENITYSISDLTGDLASVLSIENDTFIVPNEMIIIPKEVLSNDSITFGNITLNFSDETEMNADKFWAGIRVKKATIDEDFLSSFIPIGELPLDIGNLELYIKHDSLNGWMYQIHGFGAASFSIFSGEGSFDISMTDASDSVKSAMEANRDHSVDVFLALAFLGKPWTIVGLTLIGIVIFALVIYGVKRKQNLALHGKEAKMISKNTIENKQKTESKAKSTGNKYRGGYKSTKSSKARLDTKYRK